MVRTGSLSARLLWAEGTVGCSGLVRALSLVVNFIQKKINLSGGEVIFPTVIQVRLFWLASVPCIMKL